MTQPRVAIHYRRLPDSVQIFEQDVIDATPECVVTLLDAARLAKPVTSAGLTILEPGAPVVWFTYPGRWYDIGRFHLVDGTFTGFYANVLTPVMMEGERWSTTDLLLDLWVGTDGSVSIRDLDEFEEAVRQGWLDEVTAKRARETAEELAANARGGTWPPREVEWWTLQRAREARAATSA